MTNPVKNGIVPFNQLSDIERYNVKITDWLQRNPLSAIQQESIKIFNDNAFRDKWNDDKYNSEVEKYNNQYKEYTIYKRVVDQPKKTLKLVHYNYINYPLIDSEAFKMTMQNYRAEVKRYNDSLLLRNTTVSTTNNTVKSKLTKCQLDKRLQFKRLNNKLSAHAYNVQAVAYNNRYDNIILLRRIPKIRSQYELTFQSILGFYGSQIKDRNDFKQKLGKPTSIKKNEPPTLKIDYRKLSTHKIDGVQRLDICKKTAQNHIKRLREANIITDYDFINSKMAIKCRISSKILVIFDANPPKSLTSQNQPITVERSNDLHSDSDTTGTILLKKDKIKDFAIAKVIQRNFNDCLADGYKNTQQIAKNSDNNQNKKEKFVAQNFIASDNLRKLLIPAHILAQQLANNEFVTHKALTKTRLLNEFNGGNLTQDEFRTLVIYDIFKISAKQYKNSNVYAGNWTKTIQRALKTWFLATGTNEKFHFQKRTVYKQIPMYRWKLNKARKFFLENDINPLFPYEYFNPARTLSKEIGFYGLHKIWLSRLKEAKKQQDIEKQERYENGKRKNRLTIQNKIEKRIKTYLKGTSTLDNLFNYVQDNFHKDWLGYLPKMIEKEQQKNIDNELKLTA